MQNITSTAGLKNAIQLLEAEQAAKGQLLKEQFYLTLESFKPAKLLMSGLTNMVSSPLLIENILSTVMGLASGYFTKKLVVNASSNVFRKLLGSVLQFGVTKAVSHHTPSLKSIGQVIFQHIFRKKDRRPEMEDRSKK